MNEYPPQPGLEPAPQYPPPPPPPQEKPSFWKRKIAGIPIWAFVPVAIIALLIVGRALATNAPSNSATIQSTPTATPDLAATNVANAQATQNAATPYSGTPTNTGYTPPASNTNSSGNYKIGTTASTPDNYDVTVNKTYTSAGDQYNTPSSGNQYLVVDVSVKNNTGQNKLIASNMFTLTDSTGQRIDDTIASLTNVHAFVGGTLADGKVMRGQLVYEVPKGNHPYELAFAANTVFSNYQIVWDVHS